MNIIPLKSLWCELTCEQIKISMSHMLVAIIIFCINITHNSLKGKPAIASLKYLVNDVMGD